MTGWLKRLLGAAAVASAPAASSATEDRWDLYLSAASDLSGGDARLASLMTLARDDTPAFLTETDKPEYQEAGYYFDVDPDDPEPGPLFRDLLIGQGSLVYLDWKTGADEIVALFNERIERAGLTPLTASESAALAARDPIGGGSERLYFPDLVVALDAHAKTQGRRVLVFDESADSYAFLIVTPEQFDRWSMVRLGPDHAFFSPEKFEADQTR